MQHIFVAQLKQGLPELHCFNMTSLRNSRWFLHFSRFVADAIQCFCVCQLPNVLQTTIRKLHVDTSQAKVCNSWKQARRSFKLSCTMCGGIQGQCVFMVSRNLLLFLKMSVRLQRRGPEYCDGNIGIAWR